MRIWVTRAQPHAEDTARRLTAAGHTPLVAPVIEVRDLPETAIDLSGAGAIAFSSRNGVSAFSRLSQARDLPVFTTGRATAGAARAAGFREVTSAGGGLEALADLIRSQAMVDPVVWIRAKDPAGDLAALLAPSNVPVISVPAYETVEIQAQAPSGIDGVLVHSPKAARRLAHLLKGAPVTQIRLFAISDAAAAPLAHLPFAAVAVAPRPDETSLLNLLDA
jgi:uroporphyrinogen-III synthase